MFDNHSVELAKLFLLNHKREKPQPIKHKKHPFHRKLKLPKFKLPPAPKPDQIRSVPAFGTFSKIIHLVRDRSVKIIQCDGANTPLKIGKGKQVVPTNVTLTENEINDILNHFSSHTGKQITEPVFQARMKNLKIMAIVSKFTGSRFIISRLN
ncbi:MAG: hypothetical protein JSW08_02115 [archaeon]|nr:MAG: hypothetical protein JSW08_02115 [archaeon]